MSKGFIHPSNHRRVDRKTFFRIPSFASYLVKHLSHFKGGVVFGAAEIAAHQTRRRPTTGARSYREWVVDLIQHLWLNLSVHHYSPSVRRPWLKHPHQPMSVARRRQRMVSPPSFSRTLLQLITAHSWRSMTHDPVHKAFVWDRAGRYLDCQFPHPLHGHFFGGHLVKGKTVREVLPPDAARVVRQGIKRVLDEQTLWNESFALKDQKGTFQVQITFVPVGKVVLGLVTDCPQSMLPSTSPSRRLSHLQWVSEARDQGLTTQEHTIVRGVQQGQSNGAMAQHLGISERTVKFHLANIYRKLALSSRYQLMTWKPNDQSRLKFLEARSR